MPDADFLTGNEHSDHVESISELFSTETIHPNLGGSAQFAPLPVVNCLERPAEVLATASLDLDECDVVAALHHEIDIAMPTAEAMRDDAPAMLLHPLCGDALAEESEGLSLFGHGLMVAIDGEGAVTKSSRGEQRHRIGNAPVADSNA